MTYSVTVKPGHPTGVRRRSGQVFTSVPVEVESITDAMRADVWLQIVEHPEAPLTDDVLEALLADGTRMSLRESAAVHLVDPEHDAADAETGEGSETSVPEESGAPRPSRASRASRK